MNIQDLRERLNSTTDKFEIFKNVEVFNVTLPDFIELINESKNVEFEKMFNITFSDFIEVIDKYLNDTQKVELFEIDFYKNMYRSKKVEIIKSITDSGIKMDLLMNSEVVDDFDQYNVLEIIETCDENTRIQLISDQEFTKRYEIDSYYTSKILKTLSCVNIQKLLFDKEFIQEKLQLSSADIVDMISKLNTESAKQELIDLYKLENHQLINVLESCSDKSKVEVLLENKYKLNKYHLTELASTLSVEKLIEFCREEKEFLQFNDIKPYEITKILKKESQLEYIAHLEEMELSTKENKQILATLKAETKESIDEATLLPEYKGISEMQLGEDWGNMSSFGKIVVDFNKDLQIYQDLDELIYLNPLELQNTDKSKIYELCKICPDIEIDDDIGLSASTAEEYRNSEIWIEEVLQGIKLEWSNIQKVAYIDYAIGKKISYSPDWNTEVSNVGDARALWKIINSGYGVCNGIAQVEQYMLQKIGIETERISGHNHSFLKLKNIEIPNEQGELIKGDTILDPTWNLTSHRFGAKPSNFCKSYEEIRKNDIDSNGKDRECHKNDEELVSATLNLDDQNLRKIFASIGLADKDGNFPIKELNEKAKAIDAYKYSPEEKIKMQFDLLKQYCPEFAACQNSTTSALQEIFLDQENFSFNKCVVNRVYEKEDVRKEPVLYLYVDFQNIGKRFYYADKQEGEFIELPQKEFEEKFECYQMDLEKYNGKRPWETDEQIKEEENLATSSGKVENSESDER